MSLVTFTCPGEEFAMKHGSTRMTTDTRQAIRTTAPGDTDVLVIGAGIIGIAVAHFLKTRAPRTRVTLIDDGQPMAFTSAQSGEN